MLRMIGDRWFDDLRRRVTKTEIAVEFYVCCRGPQREGVPVLSYGGNVLDQITDVASLLSFLERHKPRS